MKRLHLICTALFVCVAACDININTGSGDTDASEPGDTDREMAGADDSSTTTAVDPGDEPDLGSSSAAGPGEDDSTSGGDPSAEGSSAGASTDDEPSGEDTTGDDPTGGDPTGDDPTGDDPMDCTDAVTCQECASCVQQPRNDCNAVAAACAADPDCVAFNDCYAACASLPSDAQYEACWYDECVANWPEAAEPFSDFLNCLIDACEPQCT